MIAPFTLGVVCALAGVVGVAAILFFMRGEIAPDFPDANLDGVDLALFDGASFDGARFDGVRFDGARFVGARFVGARFDEASFDGASFVGARFDEASFVGASFDGARFDGASFKNCIGRRGEKLVGPMPICAIGPFGSRGAALLAESYADGVFVSTGCFGPRDLRAFRQAVTDEHESNRHAHDYMALADFLEGWGERQRAGVNALEMAE